MSKRAQESATIEGSAVVKPRPMSLVSRNLLSAKKTSPKDASASKSPGNQVLDQSYGLCETTTKTQQHVLKNGKKDDTQTSSTRKLRGKFREHQETAAR